MELELGLEVIRAGKGKGGKLKPEVKKVVEDRWREMAKCTCGMNWWRTRRPVAPGTRLGSNGQRQNSCGMSFSCYAHWSCGSGEVGSHTHEAA
jgi:hypothetical protein